MTRNSLLNLKPLGAKSQRMMKWKWTLKVSTRDSKLKKNVKDYGSLFWAAAKVMHA